MFQRCTKVVQVWNGMSVLSVFILFNFLGWTIPWLLLILFYPSRVVFLDKHNHCFFFLSLFLFQQPKIASVHTIGSTKGGEGLFVWPNNGNGRNVAETLKEGPYSTVWLVSLISHVLMCEIVTRSYIHLSLKTKKWLTGLTSTGTFIKQRGIIIFPYILQLNIGWVKLSHLLYVRRFSISQRLWTHQRIKWQHLVKEVERSEDFGSRDKITRVFHHFIEVLAFTKYVMSARWLLFVICNVPYLPTKDLC